MTDRELLDQLNVAARKLLVTSRNAANTLSEEFQSMITGPADELEEALSLCPEPGFPNWDRVFRIEDCDAREFTPDAPPGVDRSGVGVILTHKPTGLSVQVSQKTIFLENLEVAKRAIEARVRRYTEQGT